MERNAPSGSPSDVRVLVPVKAFGRAKRRLSDRLDPPRRSALARAMADTVVAAAAPLEVVVVCDDPDVADWARSVGASVCDTAGLDLNGALELAVGEAASQGVHRVVIAHADLPFATGLDRFADPGDADVLIIPDRHGEGTNVMSIPTSPSFGLAYGPGSRHLHASAAARAGLSVRTFTDEPLGWDVDEPADLSPPPELGALPEPGSAATVDCHEGGGR